MANNNPSGPNQPLNQHPRTSHRAHVLGADAQLFTNIAVGSEAAPTDTEVIPIPPAKVVRAIAVVFSPMSQISNLTGVELAQADFILKRADGSFVVIGGSSPLADEDNGVIAGVPIFLTKELASAVYVRAGEDDALSGSLLGYSLWNDVRNIGLQLTTMPNDGTLVDVLSSPDIGNTRQITVEGVSPAGALIYNFDDASHDFAVVLTDGTDTIPLNPDLAPITVAANEVGILQPFMTNLLPGWSLRATMAPSGVSVSPVIAVAYTDTNFGPVRPDQGGAF